MSVRLRLDPARPPSRRAVVGTFTPPLVVLLLVSTLTACPRRSEPPRVTSGRVVDVDPIQSRPNSVFITVRYPDGSYGRYRLARNVCAVGESYPDCANGW